MPVDEPTAGPSGSATTARVPASPLSHGVARASEAVGDGLCVDPEPVGNFGQRRSGRVELGRSCEVLVVPCRLFTMAWNTVAVEVAGNGGAVDTELGRELADRGASSIGLDEVVDVGGGEASLGRV